MVSMYSTSYVDDIREIKEENPFESMMSRFDRAAQLLDLDPDLYAVLRVPNRELKVYIPTRTNPLKKKAAETAGKKLKKEAEEKALKIEAEGAKKADGIMAKAQEEADKIK